MTHVFGRWPAFLYFQLVLLVKMFAVGVLLSGCGGDAARSSCPSDMDPDTLTQPEGCERKWDFSDRTLDHNKRGLELSEWEYVQYRTFRHP